MCGLMTTFGYFLSCEEFTPAELLKATSSVLLEGRFTLGVSTGEALNEHVNGDCWPPYAERAQILEEAMR
jgi:hypothetical protein